MFRKTSPLQSKSEILLRNITVTGMLLFYTVFLLVPIGIAFAGSFHEWNPLSGIYRFNALYGLRAAGRKKSEPDVHAGGLRCHDQLYLLGGYGLCGDLCRRREYREPA